MKNKHMNFRKTIISIFSAGVLIFSISACEESQTNQNTPDVEGIYIVNEGVMGQISGSITLVDPESGETIQEYFKQQNEGRSAGSVVQDLSFSGEKAFLVANNSKTVEILDKENFEARDVISGLSYPRQFMAVGPNTGYLTNGSSGDNTNGEVFVIDLENHTVADTLEVGKGPESMVQVNNQVYVTNSGGYVSDSSVNIINTDRHQVTGKVEVGAIPTDITKDLNNNVWVFCKGLGGWQGGPTNSSLVKINTDNQQTTTFDLGGRISSYGNYLLASDANKDKIYFVGMDGVYEMDVSQEELPAEPIIQEIPYGLDVNPETGNIYCLKSEFQARGYAIRYNPDHTLIDSLQVGYSPNAVVFE